MKHRGEAGVKQGRVVKRRGSFRFIEACALVLLAVGRCRGDVGRCGEMWGDRGLCVRAARLAHRVHQLRVARGDARHLRDTGRCGEVWADTGRYGEMAACATSAGIVAEKS